MSAITYAPDLVEEAVLLAECTLPAADARTFRRERDRVYELPDVDRREADFSALHLRWFAHLGLHQVFDETVAGRGEILDHVTGCRVSRALTKKDEGADLLDPSPAVARTGDLTPLLMLRLRPAALLAPEALRTFLAHELAHVADMLDPVFAYERVLPPSGDGPSGDNIRRDRYRVLWDVTIDGRLARSGVADPRARDVRRLEFTKTFSMLGDRSRDLFDDWFDRIRPTHAVLVAFAAAPNGTGSTNAADSGRCPICRFPVASLDPQSGRLSPEAEALIRSDQPAWNIAQGLCSQCLDLYEARHEEAVAVSRR